MKVNSLHRSFNQLNVLKDISFELQQGSFVSILGQTGCGKSTLLNLLAGIDKPTSGEIINPNMINLSYLLQENVMLPWRSLKENITLSLEVEGKLNGNKNREIAELLTKFELSGFDDYYPEAISGGMKQRAALIRCLITEPDLLLMDEPFSNLDFDVKLKIQREILRYQKETNTTIIMVTHDIEDAIALSNQVIVLTPKPATVKCSMEIELNLTEPDPVLARKSDKFRKHFVKIWDEIKYLDNDE